MMRVRRVKWRDLEQITKIFRTGYSKKPYSEKWSKEAARSKIRRHYEQSVMFVAVEGREVMGFAILDEDRWPDGARGWVEELVVADKHRRNGIGNCLMEKALEYFKERKFKGAVLATNAESPTWGWYQRLGFRDSGLKVMVKDFK